MHKFKVNDIVQLKKNKDVFFKIRNVYADCYDAAFCDKSGKLTGGSIDLWLEKDDDEYLAESDVEKVA